jgi:hypothetical protein
MISPLRRLPTIIGDFTRDEARRIAKLTDLLC